MRIKREQLLTIVEYDTGTSSTPSLHRTLLGLYTPDSSIEYNPDADTVTDVLGITHYDINKTEPVQTFDPHSLIKDDDFDEYMFKAAMENDIEKYNGVFNVYLVSAFLDNGSDSSHAYYAVKHTGCTILPTSLGGESFIGMPVEVHFSNKITVGAVNDLTAGNSFEFTPAA